MQKEIIKIWQMQNYTFFDVVSSNPEIKTMKVSVHYFTKGILVLFIDQMHYNTECFHSLSS